MLNNTATHQNRPMKCKCEGTPGSSAAIHLDELPERSGSQAQGRAQLAQPCLPARVSRLSRCSGDLTADSSHSALSVRKVWFLTHKFTCHQNNNDLIGKIPIYSFCFVFSIVGLSYFIVIEIKLVNTRVQFTEFRQFINNGGMERCWAGKGICSMTLEFSMA